MGIKLEELAKLTGGQLVGDGSIIIESAAPIHTAHAGQISFVANKKYIRYLDTTAAAAVVLSLDIDYDKIPVIKHKDPYLAFAIILDKLYPDEAITETGIHPSAVTAPSAKVGNNSSIGALCYVGENSEIGDNTLVMPKVYIGKQVKIGNNCKIYPGVNILDKTVIGDDAIIHSGTVIGSDGFGFARHETGIKKVKQIGWVDIGDDVEIGSNVSVDRGALGPTRIGNHVKIDNLVQVAHNVEIGDYSIIVAQVGISGSTKLGKGVILAGQVGLVGHIELGDGVQVGAQSGVTRNIEPGGKILGSPARDLMEQGRIEACLHKLPELFKRVRKLEKQSEKE
ncbi:MAG: UDP-3-O-(3-hydroxymyristoyl)glucosamine N-acyltransferase [Candidatus Zixiibacteriota bacterium]